MDSIKITKDMFVVLTYELYDNKSELLEKVDNPVTHIHGEGKKLLPVIENSLEGKIAGDEIEIKVSSSDGFGEYDPSLVINDKLSNVPEEFRKVNETISFVSKSGDTKDFKVTEVNDNTIVLDGNHYLAGKSLLYKIKILDVREATQYDKEQAQLDFLRTKA